MNATERYRQAEAQAEQKKAQFLSSASTAKERIAPARLKEDLKQKAADSLSNGRVYVTEKVQERPVAAGAAAAALVLYLFRRPLSALFRRTYVQITNRHPKRAETDNG
jgi:hypothetical protein